MKYIACLSALLCLISCAKEPEGEVALTRSAPISEVGEWRSIIVSVRDAESGICSLKASRFLCKTERTFKFISL
jgi:hypothetical protein